MAPPKRGQIKAQIGEDIVQAVVFAASKTGEILGLIKKQGSNSSGGDSAGDSASSSPNNSDG